MLHLAAISRPCVLPRRHTHGRCMHTSMQHVPPSPACCTMGLLAVWPNMAHASHAARYPALAISNLRKQATGRSAVQATCTDRITCHASAEHASPSMAPTADGFLPFHQLPGFVGIPGVDSPAGASARPALLPLLDELLWALKQVHVPARHCAQLHEDETWRSAGAEVASACDKYEQYVYRSRGLYNKLCDVQSRLQAVQREGCNSNGHSSSKAAPGATKQLSSQAAGAMGDAHSMAVTDGAGRKASAEQLLRLAGLLKQVFEGQGVGVEDGISALITPHSPASGDEAWEEAASFLKEERKLAEAARAVVADVRLSPVLPLAHVQWEMAQAQGGAQQHGKGGDGQEQSRGGSLIQGDYGAEESAEECPPWAGDAMISALVRRAPGNTPLRVSASGIESGAEEAHDEQEQEEEEEEAAVKQAQNPQQRAPDGATSTPSLPPCGGASWDDVLVMDRAALSRLSVHPDAAVRHAAYVVGAQSRGHRLLSLRARQARTRAAVASAFGAPSYAHLKQEQGGGRHMATGGSEEVLQLLEGCAEAVKGLADVHVQRMAASVAPALSDSGSCCESDRLHASKGQASGSQTGQSDTGSSWEAEPWDVAWAALKASHAAGAHCAASQVLGNLQLLSVLQGLDRVLMSLFGLRLRVMPPPGASTSLSSTGSTTAGSTTAQLPASLWDSSVVAVQLDDTVSGASGIIFLDPGGGHGTRQLRFGRTWGTSPAPMPPPVPAAAHASSIQAPTYGSAAGSQTSSGPHEGGQHGAGRGGREEGKEEVDGLPPPPLVVVSCGLAWPWDNGKAGAPGALWELLHEVGHGVHLVLSSARAPFKCFGGLHLPLDVLEVPSMLFEKLLLDPVTLSHIIRGGASHSCSRASHSRGSGGVTSPPPPAPHAGASTAAPPVSAAHDAPGHAHPRQPATPGVGMDALTTAGSCQAPHTKADSKQAVFEPTVQQPVDAVTVQQLACYFRAQHYGALEFQEQVLVALSDQILNMSPLREFDSSSMAAQVFDFVWDTHSSLPHVPVTLKRATYWVYIACFLAASHAWEMHLAPIAAGALSSGTGAGGGGSDSGAGSRNEGHDVGAARPGAGAGAAGIEGTYATVGGGRVVVDLLLSQGAELDPGTLLSQLLVPGAVEVQRHEGEPSGGALKAAWMVAALPQLERWLFTG